MKLPKETPFAWVPLELVLDHRLTAMQYRILLTLLTFRNRNTGLLCPKRETIAERCGYSVNSISRATSQLVELGWLKKKGSGGRSSPTHYEFTVPETLSDPETVSDPATVADQDTKTLSDPDTKTLADPDRGKEQTREQTREQTARANGVPCPDFVSPSVWSDFLDHRRSKRAKLTSTAWKRMEPELHALITEGWKADDVLAEVMVAGWQSFKADWLRRRINGTNRVNGQQQEENPFDGCINRDRWEGPQ